MQAISAGVQPVQAETTHSLNVRPCQKAKFVHAHANNMEVHRTKQSGPPGLCVCVCVSMFVDGAVSVAETHSKKRTSIQAVLLTTPMARFPERMQVALQHWKVLGRFGLWIWGFANQMGHWSFVKMVGHDPNLSFGQCPPFSKGHGESRYFQQ